MEVPFSEAEKRFVLAEAIKTSTVPIDRLLMVLNEGQVLPSWTEMLLPHGRNLKSCIDAFEALRSSSLSTSSFPPTLPTSTPAPGASHKRKPPPENLEHSLGGPNPKRRQSGTDMIAATRTIQPRPASNGSPQSFSPLIASQQPKKRGRPSKADVEARNAEAIARGEVIPPPKVSGPRNPQMAGVGQFDARSPVQLVPSPRILAPSLPIGNDSNLGSYPSQMGTPVAATAPMMYTGPPSSGMSPQGEAFEPAATTASGKKKRIRERSKQTKGPKAGESSHMGQFQLQSTNEPSTEQPPKQQEATPVTSQSEAEQPFPTLTSASQVEAPQPASSQHSDV